VSRPARSYIGEMLFQKFCGQCCRDCRIVLMRRALILSSETESFPRCSLGRREADLRFDCNVLSPLEPVLCASPVLTVKGRCTVLGDCSAGGSEGELNKRRSRRKVDRGQPSDSAVRLRNICHRRTSGGKEEVKGQSGPAVSRPALQAGYKSVAPFALRSG
jgi:hypothetical protein